MYDCIVIGGGPAGLSTTLTLGRARRKVALFDDGTNRNHVTNASHGFITRDGINPQELKQLAVKELEDYPTVSFIRETIIEITKQKENGPFKVKAKNGLELTAEKLVLATGMQEEFAIPSIREFYGKSLFSCPYCDGWEQRDKPLAVIAEKEEHVLHLTKMVYNWSQDLFVFTHGSPLSIESICELQKRNIKVYLEPIKNLIGHDGYLEKIELITGEELSRTGGFVAPSYYRQNQFLEALGCEFHENGEVITDGHGRTTEKNIYIAGEVEKSKPSSLLISAAKGNKVAASVNIDLTMERF